MKNTKMGKLVMVGYGKDFNILNQSELPKDPVRPKVILCENIIKTNAKPVTMIYDKPFQR